MVQGIYRSDFTQNSQRWSVHLKRTLYINPKLASSSQWMISFDSLFLTPNWAYFCKNIKDLAPTKVLQNLTALSLYSGFLPFISFFLVMQGKLLSLISSFVKRSCKVSLYTLHVKQLAKSLIQDRHSGNYSKLWLLLLLRIVLQHGS